MPGRSGVTVVTTLVCFIFITYEAAGASSARLPRVLCFQRVRNFLANLGRSARRDCGGVSHSSSPANRSRECAPGDRLRRAIQYSRDVSDRAERPRRTGSPACAGDDKRRVRDEIRSVHLTIFWHCGLPAFSSRTASERAPGNEPSMVLAEDSASKGSGNADSQRKVWSPGWSGSRRARDSGCVAAHPASWRAAASYRPLRAVWALCAWALRGSREITRPLQRS